MHRLPKRKERISQAREQRGVIRIAKSEETCDIISVPWVPDNNRTTGVLLNGHTWRSRCDVQNSKVVHVERHSVFNRQLLCHQCAHSVPRWESLVDRTDGKTRAFTVP